MPCTAGLQPLLCCFCIKLAFGGGGGGHCTAFRSHLSLPQHTDIMGHCAFALSNLSFQGMTVSLRYESESYLCFDDLLQLSVAHLNCIPTSIYCPDWRLLLKNPKEGTTCCSQRPWEIFCKDVLFVCFRVWVCVCVCNVCCVLCVVC